MWDYQKESGRIGIRRTSREKDAEKHPGKTALDQSRGKGNSRDAALQRDVTAERIRYLSGGDRNINRTSLFPNLLVRLQRIHGNQHVARMLQAAEDGESNVTQDVEHTIERTRGGGQPLDSGVKNSRLLDSMAESGSASRSGRASVQGKDMVVQREECGRGGSGMQSGCPDPENALQGPAPYTPQPPSWLSDEGREFFEFAASGGIGIGEAVIRTFGPAIQIMEPEGRQGNTTLGVGAQAGPRRPSGSTQREVVWVQRGSHAIDIQCYRYFATDPADTSPIANTRHDSNYLMHRYVEGEGMSPQAALQRALAEDAELGRWVALMIGVSAQ